MTRRDTAFDPTDLAACIVKGAAENDLVRLHGAMMLAYLGDARFEDVCRARAHG